MSRCAACPSAERVAKVCSLTESDELRDILDAEFRGAQILLRQVTADIVENLSKRSGFSAELSIERALRCGELPGHSFHARRMSGRRCDDLIDLAGHAGRCLDLAKNAIARLLHDLGSKSMRHARLCGKNRSGIGEFSNRLTEPDWATQILRIKMGVGRS